MYHILEQHKAARLRYPDDPPIVGGSLCQDHSPMMAFTGLWLAQTHSLCFKGAAVLGESDRNETSEMIR